MKPSLTFIIEGTERFLDVKLNTYVNIYILISWESKDTKYNSSSHELLIASSFPNEIWNSIEEHFLNKDLVGSIQRVMELEEYKKYEMSLSVLFCKLYFLESLCTTEHYLSQYLKSDFNIDIILQTYDSMFNDSRFNNEFSKKVKTILTHEQYETLEYKASQDNESIDRLLGNILDTAISQIPNFETEDELDSIYSKIDNDETSSKILGGYTKKMYTYLSSNIRDTDLSSMPLQLETSLKNLREVLNLGKKHPTYSEFEKHVLSKVVRKINSVTDIYINTITKDRNTSPNNFIINYEIRIPKKEYKEFTFTYIAPQDTPSPTTNTKLKSTIVVKDKAKSKKDSKFLRLAVDVPQELEYLLSRNLNLYELNIHSSDKHLIPGSYIYFLISSDTIVYVGQTQDNIINRAKAHLSSKEFDRCIIVSCAVSRLDQIEQYFIKKLEPTYNKILRLMELDASDPFMQKYIE